MSEEEAVMEWTTLTRRTQVPKLTWIMGALKRANVVCRLNGASFHAPILEVAKEDFDRAWLVLGPIDDVTDDDPMFDHAGEAWWANIRIPLGQRKWLGALFAAVGLFANKVRRSIADGVKCVPHGASELDCPYATGQIEECPAAIWTVCRPMVRLEVFGLAMAKHMDSDDKDALTKLAALSVSLKAQGAGTPQDMITFCQILGQWMTRDGLKGLVGYHSKSLDKLVRVVLRETVHTPEGRMPRQVEVEAMDMISKAGTRCDLN